MIGVFKKWIAQAKGGKIDWDELEAHLIQADLGLELTQRIMRRLRDQALSAETVHQAAVDELQSLWPQPSRLPEIVAANESPLVWLVLGINGAGKTTTLAKLAHRCKQSGGKPHLVAADTFRAAAIEQLRVWAQRVDCGFTAGREGGDPAAAAHQGIADAVATGNSTILIDTAGRLHNNDNLMRELEKIKRVAGKSVAGAPQQTLLVIDGTNGSNAIEQARKFHQGIGLDGIIASKMDSSAKGGAIAAIKAEIGIETLFTGHGETPSDLTPFDPTAYINNFF